MTALMRQHVKFFSSRPVHSALGFSVKNWRYSSSSPKHVFDEFGLLQPGHFSFEVGAPNPAYLNLVSGYLKKASNEVTASSDVAHALQYGCVAGTIPVRKEIANFLTRQYKQSVDWRNIFVTCGATSGLSVLLQHLFSSDQILFAENPTYPIFAKLYSKDTHMKPVPISMEADGLNLEHFEEELNELPNVDLTERRPFKAAAYIIPTYHNPTGCCYSADKCEKLIELARKHDVLLICDDVYNTLCYEEDSVNPGSFLPSPPRLYAYDNQDHPEYKGNVVSNGSFAKIIAPGLRLGWYEAPRRIIDRLNGSYLMESGGGQSAFTSNVVAEALKSEAIDEYIQMLRKAHKERMRVVIDVVESRLSKYDVTISHPSGGYFLWVKLPSNINSARVWDISKSTENVTFVKGNIASLSGDFSNNLRLSIAFYEADEIKEGAERLCRAIERAIIEKS